MPKPVDNAFINAQFKTFVDFARDKDAGTKVRALIGNEGQERTIAAKSESVLNKIFFRVGSNKSVNNEVRTLFRDAVARMFGGEEHMPAAVKKAMKLDDYGKGRPLTARRILAVQSAVAQIAAKHDTLLQQGLAAYGDRDRNGVAQNLIHLAFASCHGNADAMDVVDKHLLSIIETGGGDLRGEQEVKTRVEGLVATLAQLKTLSRKNPVVYSAGKEMLLLGGKPVPPEIVAGLVRAANRAPLNRLRRLDDASTGVEIHQALRQFYDALVAAMDATGAAKKFADAPEMKTAVREFAAMIILSRCGASALGNIRDALNDPATSHLAAYFTQCADGTMTLPGNVSRETKAGVREAGQIAGNYLNLLAFCVQKNLERVAPGAQPVEIGACNGKPDIEGLGGNALIAETVSMARFINSRNVDDYVDATVKGQGPAADEAKRIVRNKLGEANNPSRKLGARLGANAEAMMNITLCGEMQKLAAGQASQFEKDIARGINATLRDGDRTIKLSNNLATARDELARFVTGDDDARYDTLQPAARNKVHLLMALLSQETEKAGENGTQYALNPRESDPIFNLGTPPRGTGRTTRAFTIDKRDDGGISLKYEMDKQLNSFQALDQGAEDHALAPESNFKCVLRYGLEGGEFNRVANLDYAPYDDEQVASRINEHEELPDGTSGYKQNALFRAVDSMPGQFKIEADCTLDFELNLVPGQDD